ncbi:HNH endonuclease [Vibrio splendidus]|uniref:HNH endonuclease n=1 Tax=Vibrio splendidus TaxID=29497 RepID=UPI000D34F23C|nr:HNH endonuclease signature motif containing protein [Vibrio splendidus]PTP31316.1 HNH endonuclease [Vibrio splendidus]
MSRKKFMESYGATNRNARYGWAFVNHEKKEVYFGAWDVNTDRERSLIFSMDWEFNNEGRRVNAFGEALEYIKLVENERYSLRTFPIIWDEDNDSYVDTGSAKIKEYIEEVSEMSLEVIGDEYYAIGNHKAKYSKMPLPNVAQDVNGIFGTTTDKTERESLVLSRIGQGQFRQNVINSWGNGECCALTLTSVHEILIASHIVPWSKCDSDEQRLDGANGILLCAHIDKLFDAHLLTFIKKGSKYISRLSPKLNVSLLKGLGIQSGEELCAEELSEVHRDRFEKYLEAHNNEFNFKISQTN